MPATWASTWVGDSLGPMLDAFTRVARALIDSEVPTLAADEAKVGTPEITLGVVPLVGAAVFSALVGLQRANALVLTGAAVATANDEQLSSSRVLPTRRKACALVEKRPPRWVHR